MVQQLEPVCNKSFVCFGNWGNVASGSCGADTARVCSPVPCTQEYSATVFYCVGTSEEGKVTGRGQLHNIKSGTASSFIPALIWAMSCILPVSQTPERCGPVCVWNTALSTNNTSEFLLNPQNIKHCLP